VVYSIWCGRDSTPNFDVSPWDRKLLYLLHITFNEHQTSHTWSQSAPEQSNILIFFPRHSPRLVFPPPTGSRKSHVLLLGLLLWKYYNIDNKLIKLCLENSGLSLKVCGGVANFLIIAWHYKLYIFNLNFARFTEFNHSYALNKSIWICPTNSHANL